jgi:VWFA-related protein
MRVLASSLLVLLSLPAHPATGSQEQPEFGSTVSVVSVPVFVVGRDGQALRGLQPEDFELYQDKDRVEIVSFQYIDTTDAAEQEKIKHASAARRRFLFLFDLSFTDPAGLVRAQQAAQRLARGGLAESDLAAVATFDFNRGLRLLVNFTEDRAILFHGIRSLGVPTLAQVSDPLALLAGVETTDVAVTSQDSGAESNPAVADALGVQARQLRSIDENRYREQVRLLLTNLEVFADALRAVEGRKQIVYFSSGFDSTTLVGTVGADQRDAAELVVRGQIYNVDDRQRFGDTELRQMMREVTRALSHSDSVVHSIDVTGLGTDASLTQTAVSRDLTRQVRGRESLFMFASETGGRFFKDTNDLGGALGEVLDMTSRYYILGYQTREESQPGRFHRLKVKVHRDGARVSHRAGFYEREPRAAQTALQRQFESAQMIVTGSGYNDIEFRALCLPFPQPGELQTLGVVLQIDKGQFDWAEPIGLEVYGYAVGEDGVYRDHLSQFVRVDPGVADPDQLAKGIAFYGAFRVPPGQYSIRLLVQESENGSSGVSVIDVQVPPHDARRGFLLPPVVMDDAGDWLGIGLGAKRPGSDFPFVVGGELFLPRTSFEVQSGADERLVLISFAPEGPEDTASDLQIHSSLTDSAGIFVEGGRLGLDHVEREAGGKRTFVLKYVPASLEPGDYTMRIGVGEGGARVEAYSRLRIGL